MDESTAQILMFCLVPIGLLLVARGIAHLIKPLIPDGWFKNELYRKS